MQSHRAHDYQFLLKRWRALARRTGLRLETLEHTGPESLFFLRTRALQTQGGIYLSAGIHGDEAASTEGLITWAEANHACLATLPLLLFPCLNPWGLTHNSRFDEGGRDLNRVFHLDSVPVITGIKKLIAPYQFSFSLSLHEDFDGQGLYLYEIRSEKPFWGEELLEVARPIIPIEGRARIEGRRAIAGLIRRSYRQKIFDAMGYPESIWLHLHHARRALTLETPSEFSLDQRVRAQVAVIEASVARALASPLTR